jgi:hypothetical protein
MKKLVLLLSLFLLVIIPPVFALEDIGTLIQESSNYPDEDREYLLDRVSAMVGDLEQNGLSADALVLKLKEGLHKKVRPYNIVKSLEKKKDSLLQAQSILKEVDPNAAGDENLLTDLATSIEYLVPAELVKNALRQTAAKDGGNVKKVIDSLSALIEMGVQPQQAGNIINEFSRKSTESRDINSLTKIIERARREGIDPQRVAAKMEEALKKNNSISMAEIEVQSFIAEIKQKPTIKSGQGVVISSPGITSSGVPGSEGGTPLSTSSEPSSTGPVSPIEEGGTPLE